MKSAAVSVPRLLEHLESFYGPQKPSWPVEPYDFLVWWHCGYPPSDAACGKGWESLKRTVGVDIEKHLEASPGKLALALKAGGLFPELRAMRLKEIAARVKDEFGGDLRASLSGPIAQVRKTLAKFPNIGGPGADRIMLFGKIVPVAAVPSNCPHVLIRIQRGQEHPNYTANYRHAQQAIEAEMAKTFDARVRAFMLLKRHGQEVCKRSKPKCEVCPVSAFCAFFQNRRPGHKAN